MGSLNINIEKIINFFQNPNADHSWENTEIEKFVKRAFAIGKDKTIENVFEKELGLIRLEFNYFDFFKLSKDNNANQYFKKYIENESDFDDILFDLAENNFDEFNLLYKENYIPPIEKQEISLSSSESFSLSKEDDFKSSYLDNFYEENDKTNPALKPILDELDKKIKFEIEFSNFILNQLKSNRNHVQGNLLNENFKNLIQDQTYKFMKDDFNKNNLSFWQKISYRYAIQEQEARRFFDEDYSRTYDFLERTLSELQTIKEMILNFDFYGNDMEENFKPNLSYESLKEDSFSVEMNHSKIFHDYEEEIPENVDQKLENITKKMGVLLNQDIFSNSFAVSRFFQHANDIRSLRFDIGSIIEEWSDK